MSRVDPLAQFRHPRHGGLDGVTVIRRTGARRHRRRRIEVDDIPLLMLKAERAMRRYCAESDERRLASGRGRQRQYFGCAFTGCKKEHRRGGYCDSHSVQLRRGITLKPLRPRAPNGRPVWQTKDYYAIKKASGPRKPPRRSGRIGPKRAAPGQTKGPR